MDRDKVERALQSLLGGGAGANSIRSLALPNLDDFHTFLLSELPYGQIDPDQLDRGVVEWAGLEKLTGPDDCWISIATSGTLYPNISHWQFGRKMYPIVKGFRIQYSYASPYAQEGRGSVLIGYQAPAITKYSDSSLDLLRELSERAGELSERLKSPKSLKKPKQATVDQSEADETGSSSPTSHDVRHSILNETLAKLVFNASVAEARLVNGPKHEGINELIERLSPYKCPDEKPSQHPDEEPSKHPGECSRLDAYKHPISVEVCGLARDNNSVNPFLDSWGAVTEDLARYEQLLHWPLASIPYRITKAIRIQYLSGTGMPPSLMIGYQGPPVYRTG